MIASRKRRKLSPQQEADIALYQQVILRVMDEMCAKYGEEVYMGALANVIAANKEIDAEEAR